MPFLDLNEIPRCAGQYFRTASVNGYIVLDSYASDACRIHTGLNCDYVSRLQALFLPSRHPGIFMHFESKPVARTVNKKMVQTIAGQDLPRRRVDVPAGRGALARCDRRRLGLQNRAVPTPDAFWRPPHVHCARYVAAIVAEYSTQVQHDQLIFPQSFGRRTRMRQCGSLSERDDRFKGRPRRSSFSSGIQSRPPLQTRVSPVSAGRLWIGPLHPPGWPPVAFVPALLRLCACAGSPLCQELRSTSPALRQPCEDFEAAPPLSNLHQTPPAGTGNPSKTGRRIQTRTPSAGLRGLQTFLPGLAP